MENRSFDHNQPPPASKQQWREQLKKTRKDIPPVRRQEASKAACSHLYSLCNPHPLILSFASHGTEIDLWPFNEKLCAENRLILPLAAEDKKLHLFLVSNLNQLRRSQWGILEPNLTISRPIENKEISCSLIPALGFDLKTMHRLGYGQGYYDRFLEVLPRLTQAWGVGFLEQQVDELPFTDKDISLDRIYLF